MLFYSLLYIIVFALFAFRLHLSDLRWLKTTFPLL